MTRDTTNPRISKVGITDENLTGRGGLALFARYLERVGVLGILAGKFAFVRLSKKGLPLVDLFKQVLCFFLDGTSRHLTWFDELKGNHGYAGVIETAPEEKMTKATMETLRLDLLRQRCCNPPPIPA